MGTKGGTHIIRSSRDGRAVLIVKVPGATQTTVYLDQHPTPEDAMREAVRRRDILRAGGELDGIPRYSRRSTPPPPGLPPHMVGVRRIPADPTQTPGYARWIAQWPTGKNKTKTRTFYISRWTEKVAREKAEEALKYRISADGRKRD